MGEWGRWRKGELRKKGREEDKGDGKEGREMEEERGIGRKMKDRIGKGCE